MLQHVLNIVDTLLDKLLFWKQDLLDSNEVQDCVYVPQYDDSSVSNGDVRMNGLWFLAKFSFAGV